MSIPFLFTNLIMFAVAAITYNYLYHEDVAGDLGIREKSLRDLSVVGIYNDKLYNSMYRYFYELLGRCYTKGIYDMVCSQLKDWIGHKVIDPDSIVSSALDDVIMEITKRVQNATLSDTDLNLKLNNIWTPSCVPSTMRYTDYFDVAELVAIAERSLHGSTEMDMAGV